MPPSEAGRFARGKVKRAAYGIRLTPEQRVQVERAASVSGRTVSALIRDAIHAKLPEWERSGVRLSIQPEPSEAAR